ncbi:hypothetical protein MHC_04765 [Mycoplasma haemocanis str. Illinois]|uniref:Uncharacterized protein n=1 Tax=Mycoplasma haemocanis (strain Illinois) TaxID=1111676 RepID=H6N837_MYCHN|nr:hypothetical protein [Mycoplasma haemocanis]AEW45809.1 hypothetical protein MHC_04765 [Mycoplasma haemocanis str. Illinois]
MSIFLSIKALFGLLGVGAVGVGGIYLLASADTEKYIYELIKEDVTLELLTSKNKEDEVWKGAWEKYRLENKSKDIDPWGIENWSSLKDNTQKNVPSEFLTKCESNSKKRVRSNKDSLYLEVSKWCTRDKRVEASSLLDSDNKSLLTSSTSASDSAWKAAWDAYRNDHKSTNSNPWKINNWDNLKSQDNQDAPSDFVSKCSEVAKSLVLDKEDPTYKELSKYCAKAKG